MRLLKPIAIALTLATTALSFADTADARHRHHHHHHGGRFGTGVAIGLGTGLAFGALATPRYNYGYYPGYYYQPAPRVIYRSGGSDWYEYCSRRYRSFNPSTGMYLGYDGYYHRCR